MSFTVGEGRIIQWQTPGANTDRDIIHGGESDKRLARSKSLYTSVTQGHAGQA